MRHGSAALDTRIEPDTSARGGAAKTLLLLAAAAACLAITGPEAARAYPTRPVTVIVPYPAGGGIDALARALSEPLSRTLGQPIVIEDLGGAGGTIAMGRLARAMPDGYALGIGTVDQVVNGAIYPLQYDVVNAFEPISLLASSPYLIVSKNAVPATNLKELIAWLKANGGKIAQGHNGAGGGQHLCGINLQTAINAQWPFVPYRGAAPELQDLVAGQIDLLCPLAGSALALARSGLIRPYAVTADMRMSSAPDIPTVDEAGLPGLYVSAWAGLMAPKGTPGDVLGNLNSAVRAALADPATRRRIADLGFDVPPTDQQSPEALATLRMAERDRWWPIVKAAGIKGE
jgi:tripartite-type tricarboxylate transporter receptor subunit TctC